MQNGRKNFALFTDGVLTATKPRSTKTCQHLIGGNNTHYTQKLTAD